MVKEIPLTKGAVALVDDEDFEYLSQMNWYLHSGGYAAARHPQTKKLTYMHREILRPSENEQVDHINRNRLDNRRSNLRKCTRTENMRNVKGAGDTSEYKGVSYKKGRKKPWRARIHVSENQIILGDFSTEVEAAFAYDLAAKEHFGEFAYLNGVQVDGFIPFKPREQASNKQGVAWCNSKKRWRTTIAVNGKSTHLGYFREESDAIAARESAELKYYGKLLEEII